MLDSHSVDPQLGKLDYQLLGSPRASAEEERRSSCRRPVFAIRRIAPRTGSSPPAEADFFCVESRDLTDEGFSFFMPSRPAFDSLLLAIDRSSSVEYLPAEVIHCTDVWVYPSGLVETADQRDAGGRDRPGQDGRQMVLVGCRFTQPVDADSLPDPG